MTLNIRSITPTLAALALVVAPAISKAQTFEYQRQMRGLTITTPGLVLSTNAIDFGSVATNTTVTRQLLVSNPGTGSLTFTAPPSVTGGSAFSAALTNCGSTLEPGAECLTEVTFSPTTVGTFNGVLAVTAAVANSPQEVTLVGTAFNPVSLFGVALPAAVLNRAYGPYDFKTLLNVSNESAPDKSLATWQVSSGSLPAGLSLNTSTGVLSGTPTALTAGTSFTLTATYKSNTGQRVYTIVVNGVPLEVTQIAAGAGYTCAVTTSGAAKCWGANGQGQLGDGTVTSRLTPVNVSGLTSGVVSISTGGGHACAITTSGGAKCWGNNSSGKLGDGTSTQRLTPVDVAGLTSGVASISAGHSHTCAVTTSGGAKCWGANGQGQLGDGSTMSRLTPVNVSGLTSGVANIAARGSTHTCAVTTSGGAKCWGNLVGNGSTTRSLTPADVSGLTSGVASISTGSNHTCAVTTSGGAKCWGFNWRQLGEEVWAPVDVSGLTSGVASISAGHSHTCVVTTSGGAMCWGFNSPFVSSQIPVNVSGLTSGTASISAGGDHTCALTTSGVAKCFGFNDSGQVGDGTKIDRFVPVNVVE